MALKNLFDMVKADRYTADGRETIIKAQEVETEDAKEKPEGSISPDGKRIKQGGKWVPRKNAKQPEAGSKPAAESKSGNGKKMSLAEMAEAGHVPEGASMATLREIKKNALKIYPQTENTRNLYLEAEEKLNEKLRESYAKKHSSNEESKPAEETKTETTAKFETEQENAKYEEGKKGWETVSKERLPDIKKKVEQKIDYYKKYDPYAMLGKRTGLNAAQKKAVEQNMAQAKENLAFFTGQLEGINEQMGASDSAPRVLTGDTRIRVRKS